MLLALVGNVVYVTEVTSASRLVYFFNNSAVELAHFSGSTSVVLPKLAPGVYTIVGFNASYEPSNTVTYTSADTFIGRGYLPAGIVKWTYASIVKLLRSNLDGLNIFIDAYDRSINLDKWIEVRVDGPNTTQLGPSNWNCKWEINILVNARHNSTDAFAFRTLMGQVASALPNSIEVYKYGSTAEDTGAFVGCLRRIVGRRDTLQCGYFGLKPNADIEQGCVEDHYEIDVEDA